MKQREEWVKSTFPGAGGMFPESVPQPALLYLTSYVTLQAKSLCIVTVVLDIEFVFDCPAVVGTALISYSIKLI